MQYFQRISLIFILFVATGLVWGGDSVCDDDILGMDNDDDDIHCVSPQIALTIINDTSGAMAAAISNAIASRAGRSRVPKVSKTRGITIGDTAITANNWNSWGNATYNVTDQTPNGTDAKDLNIKVLNGIAGIDYRLTPAVTAGLSMGIDDGKVKYKLITPSVDTNGFMLAPYASLQLTDELTLDASLGLGQGKFKSKSINSSADSDRWFASTNLSYDHWIDSIELSAKASYLHGVEDRKDSKTNGIEVPDSSQNTAVDQLRLGVRAGYWHNGFMPYIALGVVSDIKRDISAATSIDNSTGLNAVTMGIGIDYFSLGSNLTGGVAYNREEGRTNQDNYNLIANISLRF